MAQIRLNYRADGDGTGESMVIFRWLQMRRQRARTLHNCLHEVVSEVWCYPFAPTIYEAGLMLQKRAQEQGIVISMDEACWRIGRYRR